MRGLAFHNTFRPRGCSTTINVKAITAAAGTQMGELNEQAYLRNLTIVSGGAETVGVGGYLSGGGHSILSPTFGMAADQVLEMEVVTPDGRILTINECQNSDIFWAFRGVGSSPIISHIHSIVRGN
jgi:FAD/FMN-containing dehydrogenase